MSNHLAPYSGQDRRHHKVFITKHTEYHVRADEVVAVRPRGAKGWVSSHKALRMRLEGGIKPGTLLPLPGPPRPGQRLYFVRDDNDVVTSAIVAIVRPPKNTVAEYPASLCE